MSRRDIPGFGFDPGYEPKPFHPQQPPPDSASIFGLISRVNQGVASQPSKGILKQHASTQPADSAELQQAKSVAEKITMLRHLPLQSVKDRAFLEAKAAVERIQKGQTQLVAQTVKPDSGFRVPELPRDSSSRGPVSYVTGSVSNAQTVKPDTGFRVPELPRDSSGRGPVSNVTGSVSNRNHKGLQDNINAPPVAPNRSIVDYADDDDSVKRSGYGRDKALEEIDRYMARKRDVPTTDIHSSKKHYPESYTKEQVLLKTDTQSSKICYPENYTKEPVKRRFRESKDIETDQYVEPQKDEHEILLDNLRRNRIESETTQDSSRVMKVFDYGHSQNFVVDRIEKDTEEKKVERYSREKKTHTYRDDGNKNERYDIIAKDELVDRFSENTSRAPSKILGSDHSFERDIDKPSGYSSARYEDDYRRQYNEEKHSFDEDYQGRQGSRYHKKMDTPYDDDYDFRKHSATDKNNEDNRGKEHSNMKKGEVEADDSPINWNDMHLFDKQFDEVVDDEHDTPLYSAEHVESSNDFRHFQGKSQEFDSKPRHNDGGFWEERSEYGINKKVTSKTTDESVGSFERVTKGTDVYGVNENVTSKYSDGSVRHFERVTKGTDDYGLNENDSVKESYDFDPYYKRNQKRVDDKDVNTIDQTKTNVDLDRHYNRNVKVTDYDHEIGTRVNEDRTRVNEDRTRVNEGRTRVNEDGTRVNEGRTRVNEDRTRVNEDRARGLNEDRTRENEDRIRVKEDHTRVSEDRPKRENKPQYEDNRDRYKYHRGNVDRELETQSRDGRSQQRFGHRQQSEEEDQMGEKRSSERDYHQRKKPSKTLSRHNSETDRQDMYDVVVENKGEFPYLDVQETDKLIDKFEERKPIDRFTERNRRSYESGAIGNLEHESEQIEAVSSDFFCKDCNLVCVDESVFEDHLQGDLHLLTLQKKAQELFNIQAKTSRFDTDKYGNPLKALVAPTTLMAGINTSRVAGTSSQDVASDRTLGLTDHPNIGPSRPQGQHSNRVQVIPPKPLGPLEARSIHYTWLMLYWHTRTPAEEQLVGKYVVEYRNARETSWARAGQTSRHEFEVTGLQAGTDYLFRVYSVNGEEKSEMLESVLITTQKRRDVDRRLPDREHERGRRSRSRERIRNREQIRPRIRSGEYRRSRTPERRRRSRSPNYKKRSRSPERKRSRGSNRSKSKDTDQDQKKESDSKGENKVDVDLTKADNGSSLEPKPLKCDKGENESQENNESTDAETTSKNEEPVVDRNVECLLYKEFHTALESPLLGLEDIYEFHDFNEKIPQHYICKLCNNKGSHKVILRHIMGTPHKLAFFKKHYPDLHESIAMIVIKKQLQARLNYEGRKIEREKGRGAVKVLHMLNPVDNKGKKKYTKPVAVPAPPLEGSEELGIPPVAEQIVYLSQFDQICQTYEQTGAEDTCIVGLDFIKELMHPLMAEECKYSCSLCKSLCGASTIMYHLVGRRHRIAYLKANHPQVWNDLKHRRDLKSVLVDKIRVLSKKVGRGTLVSKVAQTERAWRRTNKKIKDVGEDGETYYEEGNQLHLDEGEPDDVEAPEGVEVEAFQGVPVQNEKKAPKGMPAIKFDIKKMEATSTIVQPINILEQSPAKKGVFDWNKENSILQDKIQNQSIIKSTRKSKFITVYSGFFQRCPVIGMQWVTEFQKPDVKLEPWFLCFMCQQRLQWKNILDHVTSTVHRLNYMKKSNYREKYSAIYTVIKTDKARAKSLIEQYSREIADLEGPPTSVEVMLELNINMEAFKGVSKIQENIKAHSASSSHVEPSAHVTASDTTKPSTELSAAAVAVTSTSYASIETAMTQPQSSTSASFTTPYPMATTAGHSAPFIATPILDPIIPTVLPDMSVPPPGFPHFPLPTFPPPPLGSNMTTAPHLLHAPTIGYHGSGGNVLNIPPPVSQQTPFPGLGQTSEASLSYSLANTSLPGQVPTGLAPSSVFQPPPFVQSLTGLVPASFPTYSSVSSGSVMPQPATLTSQPYSLATLMSAAPSFTASTDHLTNWQDPYQLPSNEYPEALPLTSESSWQNTENYRRHEDLSSGMNCAISAEDGESRPGQTNFSSQNVSSEFEDKQPMSRSRSDNRYHERERYEGGDMKDEYSYDGTYEKYKDSHGYDPERPGFDRGEKRKYESSGYIRDSRRRHYDRGFRTKNDRRSESPSRKDREVHSRRHSRSRSPENRYRNERERVRQRSHSPYGDRSTNVRYARFPEHEVSQTESYYTGQDVDNELNAEQVDILLKQYSDRNDDFDDLEDFQLAEPDHGSRKGALNDDAINLPERKVRYVGRSNKAGIPDIELDNSEQSYRKVETLDRKGLAIDLKIETINDRFAVERDVYPEEMDRTEKKRRIDEIDIKERERTVDVDIFSERRVESEFRPRYRHDRERVDRDMDVESDAWTDRWKGEDRSSDRVRGRDVHDDDQYSRRRRDPGSRNSDRHRGMAEAEGHLRRHDRDKLSREDIDALLQRAAEDVSPSQEQPDYIDHYDHDRGALRDTDRNQSRDTHKHQSRDTHRGQGGDAYRRSDMNEARDSSHDDSDFNFSTGVRREGSYPSERGRDDVYSSRHEDRSRPIAEIILSRERDSRSESGRYSGRATE